jgi:serine/threonine protein kinase
MNLDPTSDLHRRHLAEQAEACLAQLWGSEPRLALHSRLAFESIKELGEGGMGRVMRVRDRRIGREAALKLLSEDDPHLRARFQREAALMARLDHPNIPTLFEAGVTPAGEPYILMRLIRGETLGDLIAARQTKDLRASELNASLDIFLKVLDAVDYAHSQGVIHRDIKPDNIMIGACGEVLLMDWGIALDRRSKKDENSEHDSRPVSPRRVRSEGLTEEGAFIGTAGYAAPEQVEGIPVDERADVFALGVLLAELLSGRPAVPGETTLAKVIATQEGPILGPRAHGVPIAASLDWIIARGLLPRPRAAHPVRSSPP